MTENKTVKGKVLDGSGEPVKQDVGGWVFMPLDHWLVIKKQLEKPEGEKLKGEK